MPRKRAAAHVCGIQHWQLELVRHARRRRAAPHIRGARADGPAGTHQGIHSGVRPRRRRRDPLRRHVPAPRAPPQGPLLRRRGGRGDHGVLRGVRPRQHRWHRPCRAHRRAAVAGLPHHSRGHFRGDAGPLARPLPAGVLRRLLAVGRRDQGPRDPLFQGGPRESPGPRSAVRPEDGARRPGLRPAHPCGRQAGRPGSRRDARPRPLGPDAPGRAVPLRSPPEGASDLRPVQRGGG
mmetsp:Transcript_24637/g.67254  ORF Transcript_24637/g.67254 Transcript_24637/m.67254 type:complete len:236 (+) Transcript_24637:121-828(+)